MSKGYFISASVPVGGESRIIILCPFPCSTLPIPRYWKTNEATSWGLPSRPTVSGAFRRPIRSMISSSPLSRTLKMSSFFRHPGVNPLSLARATWQNLRAGRVVSGGSTLTMQTVRLSRGEDRTLVEKFIELVLATRLEWSTIKERHSAYLRLTRPLRKATWWALTRLPGATTE